MTGRRRLVLIALLSAPLNPTSGAAQDALPCSGNACGLGFRSAESSLGAVLLASGGGNPWMGSASTLGMRTGASPRIGLQLRTGFAGADVPAERAGSLERVTAFGLSGGIDVAILEGWAPGSTVGGLGSVDLFGHAGVAFLPGDAGFDASPFTWSLGARIGIFRESFTLPGITTTIAYRGVGTVAFDDASALGREAGFAWNRAHAWQVRGVVGKRVSALSLSGGIGWDDAGADVDIASRNDAGATVIDTRSLDASRWQTFASVTWTSLILSLTGEAGWQFGVDPLFMGGNDPAESGRLFGAVGARLTF